MKIKLTIEAVGLYAVAFFSTNGGGGREGPVQCTVCMPCGKESSTQTVGAVGTVLYSEQHRLIWS